MMTNFKYLQKMFFLLVMGFSMSLLCVACGDDEEDPINEEDVTPPSKDDDNVVTPPSEDVLEAVDLGLSVKWASCNVGATDVNLHGSYFAWGEIKEKEEYTEENSATYGKYFYSIYGDAQYDAARAVCGGEWRLPTKYEMQELIENCSWTWTSEGIFNGYRVTSFRTGESIFLPAAGYKQGSSLSGANSSGIYWTSTPAGADSCNSCVLNINSDDNYLTNYSRYYGYSIRPVMGEPTLLYVPSLSNVRLSDYIVTALTVSATLGNDGGSPVTERGFCVSSTSEEPTTADRKVTSTSEGPDFSATIDGLAEGTTYHIRAYAVNAKGVGYGETRSFFATQTIELPGLSDTQVSSSGDVTATAVATLADNGGDMLIVERGFCISSTSEEPTINDRKLVSTSEGSEFSAKIDGLTAGTTYYVRAYVMTSKGVAYASVASFKALKIAGLNGCEVVDLGLSVKWASCNVGAFFPEEYGGYFAWGETKEKSSYYLATYKHFNSSTKGFYDIGSNISKTSYDVAYVKWGGSWRMPTHDEIKELVDNCSWEWITYNGVNGQLVTAPNGNSIFLPAAGYRYGTDLNSCGSNGYYWSATFYGDDSYSAYSLNFDGGGNYLDFRDGLRRYGFTVRPVAE
ncbi:MAG: hypothetical protein IJA00_04660 [Bacteroidaceae bacterium]|nr:hypothetical protein [Bacteroidaceae bacterium]